MLSENLKRYRQERAMSIRELAEKSGVSPATIVRIENGFEAYPTTIKKLSNALKVSERTLLK